MKKYFLGLITAALATMTMAFGGGDIAPIETPQTEVATKTSPFYIGAAYTYVGIDNAIDTTFDFENDSAGTLIAGYDINKYVGVEGRYTSKFEEVDTFGYGIYLKPQVPINDSVKLYALLGYTGTQYKGESVDNGFGYGVGGLYNVTSNVFVFADYTADDVTESGNVGVAYRF